MIKPDYYKGHDGKDLIDFFAQTFTPDEFRGFMRGNGIKYLLRYRQKGGKEDLLKANTYLERLIDWEQKLGGEKDDRN